MSNKGYKKYMKKGAPEADYSLIKIFTISFFGMLLVFTILIKSFSPSVDVSIGDYKHEIDNNEESVSIDGRLAGIQDEDLGRNFSDLMKKAEDVQSDIQAENVRINENTSKNEQKTEVEPPKTITQEPLYKVYIGSYTSAEQAKVAKDIIQETGTNLNPIVKCIGSNNYTLQVGIFKSKSGADALLYTVQQNHLPGRVVQEY